MIRDFDNKNNYPMKSKDFLVEDFVLNQNSSQHDFLSLGGKYNIFSLLILKSIKLKKIEKYNDYKWIFKPTNSYSSKGIEIKYNLE